MVTPKKERKKEKPKKQHSLQEKIDLMNVIFLDVVENKKSFNQAVKDNDITLVTFYQWLSQIPELQQPYNYARECRADFLFEEIIEIADREEIGITTETGIYGKSKFKKTIKSDMHRHRELKIDARKWVVSKMCPKKYGDKVDITSDGEKITFANFLMQANTKDDE